LAHHGAVQYPPALVQQALLVLVLVFLVEVIFLAIVPDAVWVDIGVLKLKYPYLRRDAMSTDCTTVK
jgi:hypothetical protein